MKRRNFLKGSALITGATVAGQGMAGVQPELPEKEIYELRVYHFKNKQSMNRLGQFYKEAFIEVLNKHEVKVGAFSEYGQTEPPTIYYLLVYPSLGEYHRIKKAIWNDAGFLEKSKAYFDETAENGTYTRFETYLLEAFDEIPRLQMPDENRGLFELRTYESNNEEAGQRKINMFNRGELSVFHKTGLHATFFGEILAGPQMPALVYMLWFKDMEERNINWQKFSSHPDWVEMKAKPEYANAISVVNRKFLLPLEYSQI